MRTLSLALLLFIMGTTTFAQIDQASTGRSKTLFRLDSSFCSHLELGLGIGALFNTSCVVVNKFSSRSDGTASPTVANFVGSVKLLYNAGSTQWGLSVMPQQLSCEFKVVYKPGITPKHYILNSALFFADPAIPICIEANKKTIRKNIESYYGADIGYLYVRNSHDSIPYHTDRALTRHGATAGMHIGSTYFLDESFGVNAEIACNYMLFLVGSTTYSFFTFPLTLGVRFRF